MKFINDLWESLKSLAAYTLSHPLEMAGIIIAYFSLILPIKQYLGQRKLEEKDKRFKNYHELIKELVNPDGGPFIDRQIAVVFELRNFKEYYEVSDRILLGLNETWPSTDSSRTRLLNEIELTRSYIKSKTKQ